MDEKMMHGCSDGCGRAVLQNDANKNNWLKLPDGKWRCPECQNELARHNRWRQAIGRAYRNDF